MASRPIAVKLRAEDAEAIVNALRKTGDEGAAMAEKLEKSFTPTARAVDNLKRSLDPLYDSQRRIAQATGLLDRALKAGTVTAAEHARLVQLVNERYAASAVASRGFVAANNNIRTAVQQAGFQVGDFAVQIASGQSAMRAFVQQGSQLLGFFGPWGAVFGAGLAVVGALATGLLGLGDSADKATDAEKRRSEAMERAKKITEELTRASDNRARSLEAERRMLVETAAAEVKAVQDRENALARMVGGRGLPETERERLNRLTGGGRTAQRSALIRELTVRAEAGEFDDAHSGLFRADRADLRGLDEDARKAFEEEQKRAKEAAETIRKENEARDEAINTVKRQIEELGREADAVRQGERERFVLAEVLKAEAALRKGLVTDTEFYVEQVRKAAEIKFDEIERTKQLAEAEKKAAREAEQRAKEEQRRFERIVDEGTNRAADLLYDAFTGRISSIGEFLKQTLLRATAQGIASAFLRPLVIAPAVQLAGQVAGSIGIPVGFGGGTAAAGYGGGLATASNVLSLGSSAYSAMGGGGLFTGLGGITLGGLFTAPTTFAPTAAAIGPGGLLSSAGVTGSGITGSAGLIPATFGQFLGGVGLGFGAGSLLGGLVHPAHRQSQSMIGAGVGALAGAAIGSFIPGIGTILGGLIGGAGGGLFGGLFGPGKSVGPGQGGTLAFQTSPRVYGLGADNGGDPALAAAYLNALGAAVTQIVDAAGGTGLAGGGRSVDIFNNRKGFSVLFGSGPRVRFATQDEATAAALRYLLGAGIAGASAGVNQALRASDATTPEGFLSDVQLAIGIDRLKLSELDRAIADINDRYREQIERAKQLGLASDELVKARDREIAAVRAAELAPFAQAGASIRAFLEAQALSPESSLSPTGRLTEAQRQFGQYLEQVRGGDLAAVSPLLAAGQNLLAIGRQNFASTVDFANIEHFVRSSLASVGQQVTSDSYIEAVRQQTQAQIDQFQQLKEELQRLRSDLALLGKKLAA